MPPKITNEMTHAAYSNAKEVFHGRLSRQQALEYLDKQHGMNKGSASDYIVNFRKMMSGDSYERTYNTYATDYILSKILVDYGSHEYLKAIQSVTKHIEYYEAIGRGNLNSIREVLLKHKSEIQNESTLYPDEITEEYLSEGVKKSIVVNSYERNPQARKKCLEHYGFNCSVCGFSFENSYGSVGKNFIHVHHLIPVANIGESCKIEPIKDLRPVCPNCHAMLHKKNPPFTIEELQQCLKNV